MTPIFPRLESPRAVLPLVVLVLTGCGAEGSGPGRSDAPDPASGGSVPPAVVATPVEEAVLEEVDTGEDVVLQAISPVSPSVVWVSGHGGTWIRTEDGGTTWTRGTVAGHEDLEFRDVHAFDGSTALLLSSGEGPASRIFRTADGGESWQEVWAMVDPEGFLDCMDFWDDGTGLAYGDAVEGETFVLATGNGGRSWSRIPPQRLPEALDGEGGFAASGSCLRTAGEDVAWIGTANGPRARLLATRDGGRNWESLDLPLAAGEWRGTTAVGMRPDGLGFAVGGDLGGGDGGRRVALTADGGLSWSTAGELAMNGPAYGAAWVPQRTPATLFAVGPGGMDWSRNGGLTWEPLTGVGPYWAVEFASPELGWAAGSGGRLTRIVLR